jgi:rubrerythrin
MKDMTRANLEAAFAGESQAHMKYTIFADKAESEGYPEVARLFRAIAYAERVHATNHFKALDGLNDTVKNLAASMGGEHYEVNEMYPAFDAVAKLQNEKKAMLSIHYAVEAEKIHEAMYEKAKSNVAKKKDIKSSPVYVCSVCGHTVVGDAPDRCPVCNVLKKKYVEF